MFFKNSVGVLANVQLCRLCHDALGIKEHKFRFADFLNFILAVKYLQRSFQLLVELFERRDVLAGQRPEIDQSHARRDQIRGVGQQINRIFAAREECLRIAFAVKRF